MNTREAAIEEEFFNEVYAKTMKLVPNFDESTLDARITQGDMCTYADLPKTSESFGVSSLLAALNF